MPEVEIIAVINKWEGEIIHAEEDKFVANIYDLSMDGSVIEEIEFGRGEVSRHDQGLLK